MKSRVNTAISLIRIGVRVEMPRRSERKDLTADLVVRIEMKIYGSLTQELEAVTNRILIVGHIFLNFHGKSANTILHDRRLRTTMTLIAQFDLQFCDLKAPILALPITLKSAFTLKRGPANRTAICGQSLLVKKIRNLVEFLCPLIPVLFEHPSQAWSHDWVLPFPSLRARFRSPGASRVFHAFFIPSSITHSSPS